VGDAPTFESDLAMYRATYGLPDCTQANGCLKKASVGFVPPSTKQASIDAATGLDLASAACPSCKLLLVEIPRSGTADLGPAAQAAARDGANVVSIGYLGGNEDPNQGVYDAAFKIPGVTVFTMTSSQLPPTYPAASPNVLAVGGTSTSFWAGSWHDQG